MFYGVNFDVTPSRLESFEPIVFSRRLCDYNGFLFWPVIVLYVRVDRRWAIDGLDRLEFFSLDYSARLRCFVLPLVLLVRQYVDCELSLNRCHLHRLDDRKRHFLFVH